MDDAGGRAPAGVARTPGLGPHCVGARVVVRRLVRGELGPTGGPAFTDVLGTMLSWDGAVTVLEREDGSRVTIAVADVVSGKPVPPRPSVRSRVSVEAAERRAAQGWPAIEQESLGHWLLRASGGFSARANSVLAVGDPGVDLGAATAAVRSFYTARGLPALAQAAVGSGEEAGLTARGWRDARPGEAATAFQVAGLAQVARRLRTLPAPDVAASVTVDERVTETWLASDARALRHRDAAVAVLEGPDEVGFVTLGDPAMARGRVSHVDDWAGISDVWVSPAHRRRGLAVAVLRALVDWAAERGATTVYLQVRGDNTAALALYDRLGFVTHHEYRYLRAPESGSADTTAP